MNNNIPKISVVMSVYNGEQYLREAIDSILNQSFTEFEFIIINDGSTDNSLQIIESYKDERIVLINQSNTGLAKALNIGIEKSRSNFIARMDADDISLPDRLQKQYDFLEQHHECVAVGGNAEVIDRDGNYVFTSNQVLNWEEIKNNLPVDPSFHSSTMYRKTAFDKVGGYPEIYGIEDSVFFNKLAKVGELRNLPDVLIKYRLCPTAVTMKSSKKDSKIIQKIINDAINNVITKEQINTLKEIALNKDLNYKTAIYHLHLAKKYLWNNYQPRLVRQNLIKSFKLNPISIIWMIYYILSFLPEKSILFLYKKVKRYNIGSFF